MVLVIVKFAVDRFLIILAVLFTAEPCVTKF